MVRPTVFISYKRDDAATAELVDKIERYLAALQIDVLRDTGIEAGDRWSGNLYNWLMTCSAAVAIIGEEPAKSEWCRREWWFLRERQFHDNIPLIPISVDGTDDSGDILSHIQNIKRADAIDETTFASIAKLENVAPSPQSYLAAHHAWLRWQFNEMPMWGREPFSLRDVYVDTECGKLPWGEITDEQKPRNPFTDSEECGGRHDIVDTVMDLVRDRDFREPIVVQGPPGGGKSAFTQRLANELLEQGFKPILVRFRDFRLTQFTNAGELIEDALRIGPVEEEPPRPPDRIIDDALLNQSIEIDGEALAQTVFILDGWDEVSLTGNTSYQAQLVRWLPRFRQFISDRPGRAVKLILTGRPSVEVRDSEILLRRTPILTLRLMQPERLRSYASSISRILESADGSADDEWHVDLQRLEPVFASYDTWFKGRGRQSGEGRSMDVMGSPLLAFLALRTLSSWEGNAADLVAQPTALYKVLIDTTVAHGGQAMDQDLEKTARLSGDPLRFLLHRVAGVISILGRETVSFDELDLRFKDDRDFKRFYKNAGLAKATESEARLNTLLGLIVSFFFKGGNTDLGCEFLHKSFREYLFAESIVALLENIAGENSGCLADPRLAYWQDFDEEMPQFAASRRLAFLLGPQWLTDEVRAHLFWLIEQAVAKQPARWVWLRDLLLDVYIWWAEGVHLRPQPGIERGQKVWRSAHIDDMLHMALPFDPSVPTEPPRTTTLDAHLGEALMELTALVHALLIETAGEMPMAGALRDGYRHGEQHNCFAVGASGHAKAIFARINAAGWRKSGAFPGGANLRSISLSGEAVQLQLFAEADLRRADLRRADLRGAYLIRADLREADLRGAHLIRANLSEADLREADLIRANLRGADLREADLRGAHLRGADLSEADLRGAHLIRANLSEADLRGADLRGANLRGANLRGANLRGADLRGAHLIRADLREADLRGADCNRVNIDSCRLQFADLSSAQSLSQAAVNSAIGNSETKLPPGLTRPAHWSNA